LKSWLGSNPASTQRTRPLRQLEARVRLGASGRETRWRAARSRARGRVWAGARIIADTLSLIRYPIPFPAPCPRLCLCQRWHTMPETTAPPPPFPYPFLPSRSRQKFDTSKLLIPFDVGQIVRPVEN
jgi:hypothetical protein